MSGGEWQQATERLRGAILAKCGSFAEFARRVGMEPTQLSATLKPHRRPEPETLDRFSAVLEWDPNVLRGWYDYSLADSASPQPATRPIETLWPDSPNLTVAEMVEDVEKRKGAWYQAELREARETLSREKYEDFCVQLWRMFEGNSMMAFGNLKRRG